MMCRCKRRSRAEEITLKTMTDLLKAIRAAALWLSFLCQIDNSLIATAPKGESGVIKTSYKAPIYQYVYIFQ